MKVLHVIDSQGVYGAEMVLLTLMEAQRKRGIDAVLASIGERGIQEKQIEHEARRRNLPLTCLRMHNGPNPFGAYRLLRLAKEQRFDLIHSHGYKPDILLGFIPKEIRRVPIVATLHGWTSRRRFSRLGLYEWLDRKSLRFIDHVVPVSRAMLSKRRIHDRPARTTVVHNGVSLDNAQRKPVPENDAIALFCRSGFVVGSVGRLSEEKGYRFLIEAVGQLRRAGIDVRLVIIGDGPERRRLTARIRETNLTDSALLPGYRDDASAYMSCFDVFVLPSLTEGLPITLLEAMQAGVPVIATSVGGIPEVLNLKNAGLLVPPGDADSLTGALRKLYRNRKLRAELGARGKRLVRDCLTKEIMAQRYHEVYEKVLQGTPEGNV